MSRFGYEEAVIRVDHITIRLRPTLRAATRLHAEFGGFEHLIRAVMEGSVSALASVVREGVCDPIEFPRFLETIGPGVSLKRIVDRIAGPILAHVIALSGFNGDDEQKRAAKSTKRISIGDYHRQLYRIATGWLGWEPELAWNSTATEIREAYDGRLEMLRAIFGGDKDQDDRADMPLDDKFALAMTGLLARQKRDAA